MDLLGGSDLGTDLSNASTVQKKNSKNANVVGTLATETSNNQDLLDLLGGLDMSAPTTIAAPVQNMNIMGLVDGGGSVVGGGMITSPSTNGNDISTLGGGGLNLNAPSIIESNVLSNSLLNDLTATTTSVTV